MIETYFTSHNRTVAHRLLPFFQDKEAYGFFISVPCLAGHTTYIKSRSVL